MALEKFIGTDKHGNVITVMIPHRWSHCADRNTPFHGKHYKPTQAGQKLLDSMGEYTQFSKSPQEPKCKPTCKRCYVQADNGNLYKQATDAYYASTRQRIREETLISSSRFTPYNTIRSSFDSAYMSLFDETEGGEE